MYCTWEGSSRLYPLWSVLRQQNKRKITPSSRPENLTTETVDGASLALESIYNIEGSDGLSLGVFGVGDGIADDAFEEDFEDTSGFFVDETGDTLDTTTACETANSGLCDSLWLVSDAVRNKEKGKVRILSRRILR